MLVKKHLIFRQVASGGDVVEVQGDYIKVEIIPDLLLDVDAQFRKFFVPGKVIRVHKSSLEEVEAT